MLPKEIKFGNFSVTSTSMFGKALVDASNLEQNQNWAGCVIHPNAVEKCEQDSLLITSDNDANFKRLLEMKLITKYLVPMKKYPPEEMYAVNWGFASKPDLDEEKVRNSFGMYNKKIDPNDPKIENTVEFFIKHSMPSRSISNQEKINTDQTIEA